MHVILHYCVWVYEGRRFIVGQCILYIKNGVVFFRVFSILLMGYSWVLVHMEGMYDCMRVLLCLHMFSWEKVTVLGDIDGILVGVIAVHCRGV